MIEVKIIDNLTNETLTYTNRISSLTFRASASNEEMRQELLNKKPEDENSEDYDNLLTFEKFAPFQSNPEDIEVIRFEFCAEDAGGKVVTSFIDTLGKRVVFSIGQYLVDTSFVIGTTKIFMCGEDGSRSLIKTQEFNLEYSKDYGLNVYMNDKALPELT